VALPENSAQRYSISGGYALLNSNPSLFLSALTSNPLAQNSWYEIVINGYYECYGTNPMFDIILSNPSVATISTKWDGPVGDNPSSSVDTFYIQGQSGSIAYTGKGRRGIYTVIVHIQTNASAPAVTFRFKPEATGDVYMACSSSMLVTKIQSV
jgi:hypothetical protein